MRSSQPGVETPSRPLIETWNPVIERMNKALKEMRISFEGAFVENQKEVQPRELIKRAVFNAVWEKLENKNKEFASLQELDAYYQALQLNVKSVAGEVLRLEFAKELIRTKRLTDPVSERKIDMLKQVVSLYHAMVRCRYLVKNLNQNFTPEKTEDMVFSMQTQAQVNNEQLAKIDLEFHQQRSVNALIAFNQYLVNLMRGRGYGDVKVDGLLNPVADDKALSAFVMLNAKLNELPTVQELADLMNGKIYDSQEMRTRKIQEHLNTIQTIRHLLRIICNEVYIASCEKLDHIQAEYHALVEIKQKISNSEVLETFFRQLVSTMNAIESAQEIEANIPVLRLAGRNAIAECGKQSQSEQLTRLALTGWSSAAVCVNNQVLAVIGDARQVMHPYTASLASYNEAIEVINAQDKMYRQAEHLVNDWRTANDQMKQVLEQSDALLDVIESRVLSATQTVGQYAGQFFKHHWPKMVIGAAIVAVPAAAVSFAVLSAASAAVLIPAGVVLGGAGGAGAGLVADKVSESKQKPAVWKPRPNINYAGVDSEFIVNRLLNPDPGAQHKLPALLRSFKPGMTKVPVQQPIDLPDLMPEPAQRQLGTPPAPDSQRPASVVHVDASAQQGDRQPDAAPEEVRPGVFASLVRLPQQLASVPGQLGEQVVALPGRLAQLPGVSFFVPAVQGNGAPPATPPAENDKTLKK